MAAAKTRAERRAASAQRILEAAQVEFGEKGLAATTIRAIAERAGVDPSLVIQHYRTKADLFAIATRLPAESTGEDVADHLADVLDVRLGEMPPETRALVRSMLTAPEATEVMRSFLNERVENLRGAMDGEDAQLRAALIVSSILGLTVARHFLKLDGLDAISEDQLTATVRPWLASAVHPADRGADRP